MNVIVIGGSGETGRNIINGLIASSSPFNITALTRPSSLDSPKTQSLREAGINVASADLAGPEEELVDVLKGADVVISAVNALALRQQIPLAKAAKKAGVKRFIPCTFATASPPRGVMELSQIKDDIFAHIKALHLPYTIVDVGWWYQLSSPRVPSGRLDGALINPVAEIFGGGNVRSAMTHTRDIGTFVARIVADERTLNKQVFAYGTVMTQHEVWDTVERASGENLVRLFVSNEELENRIVAAKAAAAAAPEDPGKTMAVGLVEYQRSWGVRGDNTPEYAKYLGYLDARALYPDIEPIAFDDYLVSALQGKEKMPWV